VAHQWWAIGVGSDSQRAPFVDESLANYTAVLYFEDRYGKERAAQIMDTHLRQTYAMGRMMGGPDRPANLRTSAYAGNVQYGAVVYGKGALFYDALRRATGDAAFFEALRLYYARYQGKLAAPRDFINILKAKAPKANVEGLYARWIEGAHGDEDIAGGKPMGLNDLLGGMLGGMLGGEF
jgi:aminopeptidase N